MEIKTLETAEGSFTLFEIVSESIDLLTFGLKDSDWECARIQHPYEILPRYR